MRFALLITAFLVSGCAGARVAQEQAVEGTPGALAQPLRDVNVVRTKIPGVLLEAMDRPYVPPAPMTCREVANQIRPLDDALGPDLDAPPSIDNPSALERGGAVAGEAIVDAVRGTATDLIPLRSWVRMLSGAERHDRLVRQAIEAGAVRRSYLKGIGFQLRCLPPGAPQPIAIKGQQEPRSPQARRGGFRLPWRR